MATASLLPVIGKPAPDFTLPSSSGEMVSLKSFKNRKSVVLYFYPKDDTPGCTTEACGFRDANAVLGERGADVWGISPQGQKSKAAFIDKFGLTFPLLIDADHAVAEAYGSWVEKFNYGRPYLGVARRTFLIDPDGRIAHVWEKVSPNGHADDVLGVLDGLRGTRP